MEMRRIALLECPLCSLRRAQARGAGVVRKPVVWIARGAGVVRTPVVLHARSGQRGRVLRVVPITARCAARDPRCAWFS